MPQRSRRRGIRRLSWGLLAIVGAIALAGILGATDGRTAQAQQPFGPVAPGGVAPVGPIVGRISVTAGGPYSGRVGEQVFFRATVSSPLPPGTLFQFRWSFGDGQTGVGQTTSHAYSTPGTYPVTVTVVGGGQTAFSTTSASITRPAQALSVSAGGPYSGRTNQPVQFSSSVSGAALGTAFSTSGASATAPSAAGRPRPTTTPSPAPTRSALT